MVDEMQGNGDEVPLADVESGIEWLDAAVVWTRRHRRLAVSVTSAVDQCVEAAQFGGFPWCPDGFPNDLWDALLSPVGSPGDPVTPDDLFRQDSTFHFVRGLADPNGVSFESVNFLGRYVRHRDLLLWLEAPASADDDLFRRDATFVREPAAVLIDDGTELNPVDD